MEKTGYALLSFMEEKNLTIHKLRIKDILLMTTSPILVYLGNFYFNNFHLAWYKSEHIDSYFHFMGGMSIAYAVIYFKKILEKKNLVKISNRLIELVLVVSVVTTTAVVWEMYELTYDLLYHTQMQPSNFDTIKDLFLGTTGGACLAIFMLKKPATDK